MMNIINVQACKVVQASRAAIRSCCTSLRNASNPITDAVRPTFAAEL